MQDMRDANPIEDWRMLRVSSCRTHHQDAHGRPVYEERFDVVLSFHAPGFAPASRNGRWFLIDSKGALISKQTWRRVAGFYEGFCAVEDENGWTHIDEFLKPAYDRYWKWAGNFQKERCPVQVRDGSFFHIDTTGQKRSGPWVYAGDYHEGVSAVRISDGWTIHIDLQGNPIHEARFLEAREFHKGWAVVRDEHGWFHVDRSGRPCGTKRYDYLEPFYNGRAYAQRVDGARVFVYEDGSESLLTDMNDEEVKGRILDDAMAWWRTLAVHKQLVENDLRVRSLMENDPILRRRISYWSGLAAITVFERHRSGKDPFEIAYDLGHHEHLAQVLADYAEEDWPGIIPVLNVPSPCTIVDVGGGVGTMLRLLLAQVKDCRGILVDRKEVLATIEEREDLALHAADMFHDALPRGDVYLLTRVLHDWSDAQCLTLLHNVRASAPADSTLFIIEHNLDKDPAHLLQAYLWAIGGQERTADEYQCLLASSGWRVRSVRTKHRFLIVEAIPNLDTLNPSCDPLNNALSNISES